MKQTPETISAVMSEMAGRRWKGKTEAERSEHMRMMGQASGKARKPRKRRAK
jgi:hypothetical protein